MRPDPTAFPRVLVQVDLDGIWAVRTAYGLDAAPEFFEQDAVYEEGLRRFLEIFERRGVRATLFAVGRDAMHAGKARLLAEAAAAGHEIANHSMSHRIGLGGLERAAIRREIEQASDAIQAATGVRPVGFRAPGYDASPAVLQGALDCGLLYDASLLPSRVGGLMRLAAARLRRQGADSSGRGAAGHYGSGPVWRAPREPYRCRPAHPWERAEPDDASIVEVPVAVSARLGLPVHASVGMAVGLGWTRRALSGLLRRGGTIAYVFHGVDLTGPESLRAVVGRPGLLARRLFGLPLDHKVRFVEAALDVLLEGGRPLRTRDRVEGLAGPGQR